MPYIPPPPPHGGLSDWRSPLSIRETMILLLAVGSLVLSWSQVNSRLDMIQRDIAVQASLQTTLRQDMTTLNSDLRAHEQLAEHPIGADRMTMLTGRLESLEGSVRRLEQQHDTHR